MKSVSASCACLIVATVLPPAAQGFPPALGPVQGNLGMTLGEGAGDIPVAAHEVTGRVLVTGADYRGLSLHAEGAPPIRVTDGVNAGYGASLSPDGRYVCYKGFRDSAGGRLQAALLFDIGSGQTVNLSGWRPRAGTPSVSAAGTVGFTIGRTLHILDAALDPIREVGLEGYANLIGFSPDGRRVAYPDGESRIRAVDLSDGKDVLLTREARGFWGPAFSPDGSRLLAGTADGDVAVFPSVPGGRVAFLSDAARVPGAAPEGPRLPAYLRNPVWLDHRAIGLLSVPAGSDSREVRRFLAIEPGLGAGGRILASSPLTDGAGDVLPGAGSLYRVKQRRLERAGWERSSPAPVFRWKPVGIAAPEGPRLPAIPTPRDLGGRLFRIPPAKLAAARDSVMLPDVPYLSQTHDTRDGWNGHSSCGATSAIMTLAYYGLLPKHPLTVKKGSTHVTDYGFYITEKYAQGTTTFNIGSKDPDGVTGYGGFGYITKDDWADTKGSMAAYLKIHGARSEVDWSATLAEVKREIDARHPFVVLNALTASGHYIVAIGYFKGTLEGTVIFNDPYGNRNHSTYNSYRGGIRVYYDMPGENNGYANLKNAGCFIYSRAERAVTSLAQPWFPARDGAAAGVARVNALGIGIPAGARSAAGAYFPAARIDSPIEAGR